MSRLDLGLYFWGSLDVLPESQVQVTVLLSVVPQVRFSGLGGGTRTHSVLTLFLVTHKAPGPLLRSIVHAVGSKLQWHDLTSRKKGLSLLTADKVGTIARCLFERDLTGEVHPPLGCDGQGVDLDGAAPIIQFHPGGVGPVELHAGDEGCSWGDAADQGRGPLSQHPFRRKHLGCPVFLIWLHS